jgi:serine/threonine protein kinase
VAIVQSEDGVLGRGAFGEVRVATWCGAKVAAKTLHALRPSNDGRRSAEGDDGGGLLGHEDVADLVREFSVLSQLRHPNLVLFLGVTVDPLTKLPQAILTELLPHSVYDLLETHQFSLEPHEVLGLALDLTQALSFLHGRAIVQ